MVDRVCRVTVGHAGGPLRERLSTSELGNLLLDRERSLTTNFRRGLQGLRPFDAGGLILVPTVHLVQQIVLFGEAHYFAALRYIAT